MSGTWSLLLIAGSTNCVAIFLFTYASQHSKSATVALLRYIGVFFNFMIDLLVFRETFTAMQLFGVALILGTNIASIVLKLINQHKAEAPLEDKLYPEVELEPAKK